MRIAADGDQLDQVLINLVRNGVDAALETGGGVRVGWRKTDGIDDYVEVSVQDDGPGLSSTENLFVPFFTTKPRIDQQRSNEPIGTGLGLETVFRRLSSYGTNVDIDSEVGKGAKFTVRIPIEQDKATGAK